MRGEYRNTVVYKYSQKIDDKIIVALPKNADILMVGMQDAVDIITFWVAVDPDADIVSRTFAVYGTGHEFRHEKQKHVGSYKAGPFVWHVYEVFE